MNEAHKFAELKLILTMKFTTRFWSNVKMQTNGCWEWQKSVNHKNRYGQVRVGGKVHITHRVAYSIYYGKPPALLLRHFCNNAKCCNPFHLIEGTQAENMEDMFKAFRHRVQREEIEKQLTKIIQSLSSEEKEMLYRVLQRELTGKI